MYIHVCFEYSFLLILYIMNIYCSGGNTVQAGDPNSIEDVSDHQEQAVEEERSELETGTGVESREMSDGSGQEEMNERHEEEEVAATACNESADGKDTCFINYFMCSGPQFKRPTLSTDHLYVHPSMNNIQKIYLSRENTPLQRPLSHCRGSGHEGDHCNHYSSAEG